MIIKNETSRTLAPEGPTPAVCVDFVDLGVVSGGQFGDKHKVQLTFETPHRDPEHGWPLRVSTRMNVSMFETARLRLFLEAWRGKRYSEAEAKAGVDMEGCIGRPAYITIEHSDDGQYANIQSIMPLPSGLPAPSPADDYVRIKDKDGGWDTRSPNSTAGQRRAGDRPAATSDHAARPVNAEAQVAGNVGGLRYEPSADGEGYTVHDDDLPF